MLDNNLNPSDGRCVGFEKCDSPSSSRPSLLFDFGVCGLEWVDSLPLIPSKLIIGYMHEE
jgi:hypothetical protein